MLYTGSSSIVGHPRLKYKKIKSDAISKKGATDTLFTVPSPPRVAM